MAKRKPRPSLRGSTAWREWNRREEASHNPRPPTRRQREMARRFKHGKSIYDVAVWMTPWSSVQSGEGIELVEQAIRAVMVWEGRNG